MYNFMTGFFMGVADLIPGVSGGTIAFIFGVYDDFIGALSSLKVPLLGKIFRGQFKAAWKEINGTLLFSIVAGIALALFSLSSFMHQWLNEPVSRSYLFAAFFGFIISSSLYMRKKVGKWNSSCVVGFFLGLLGAFLLTVLAKPIEMTETVSLIDPWLIYCGIVSSCAMLLPGISGSYLLAILGVYPLVIEALASFNAVVLLNVGVGVLIGFTSFSKLLDYLLKHYHDLMVSTLIGVMLGALPAVWPWWSLKTNGKRLVPVEKILPSMDAPETYIAVGIFVVSASLAFIIENKSFPFSKNRCI